MHKMQSNSAQVLIGEINRYKMLIKNLFSLFCGSESLDGRSDCASDVIEEKEHIVIIPEKFKDNIQKLQDYCGVTDVWCINNEGYND